MDVRVSGHDKLLDKIKKLTEPEKTFDEDVRKVALNSVSTIVKTSPRKTGHTARGWTKPRKLSDSTYQIENDIKTSDGKHSIPIILDQGRGEIRPKRAKLLFIPLTNKGASRSGKFGTDFVLSKKAKAYSGTKYLTKAREAASVQLRDRITKRLATING